MRFFISLAFLFTFWTSISAQDIVIFHNGDLIQSKVIEISPLVIKYKKFNNLDGPIYTVLREEIFMINYESGEKELFGVNNDRKDGTHSTKKGKDDVYPSKGTILLQASNLLALDILNESLIFNFGMGGFVSDNIAVVGNLLRTPGLSEVSLSGLYYTNSGFYFGPAVAYDNYWEQLNLRFGLGYAIFLNKSISIEPQFVTNLTNYGYNGPFGSLLIGGKLGIYINR